MDLQSIQYAGYNDGKDMSRRGGKLEKMKKTRRYLSPLIDRTEHFPPLSRSEFIPSRYVQGLNFTAWWDLVLFMAPAHEYESHFLMASNPQNPFHLTEIYIKYPAEARICKLPGASSWSYTWPLHWFMQ